MDTARPDTYTHTDTKRLDRRARRWAVAGLVLLLPTAVGSWLLVLATERGSRCFAYREGCGPVPGELLWVLFQAAAALGLAAAVLPRTRWAYARTSAVVLQWTAQSAPALLILSGGL
ncbi:hypothetical protein [Streptomyces sp. CRN 30]|uniref:hypothetical protein n=1 Tax=Streptomyces sp. CRN 30 TaxID=3075613 RepID=UPI002A7FEF32|nr:hypothetical protein [Streptomyces sp. CRN 30]